MFVVAVNVKDPKLELVGEGVDDFNRGGIHGHIVEDIARYRQHVGLSVGDALQQTFEPLKRIVRAEMNVGNLRDFEAVKFGRQIFYRHVEEIFHVRIFFDSVAVKRHCQTHQRINYAVRQHSPPRRIKLCRLVEFAIKKSCDQRANHERRAD